MTTSYKKINNEVIKFNQGLAQLQASKQLNLFIEFNKKVLELLEQLTQDKIGLELLNALEKKLKESLNTTEYVKQLHCLLIDDENNFVSQQARKKYKLGAKAFYDLISWMHYGTIIGLLTGIGVFVTLVLCLVITPAPVHLVLIGIALIAGGCLNKLFGDIVRPRAVKLLNQHYDLQQEHTKLLTDFDESIPNQQEISLTEEEKTHLSGKSIKFYDTSDYYTQQLNDGYHYEYSYLGSPSLYFSRAGETKWLCIKDRQKFNAELISIRQTHLGSSSYELSSAQIQALITNNTYEQHHPVMGAQCSSYIQKEDKTPFEAALRMKKLRFFYQEQGEEIQQKIASLSI